MGLFDRAGGGLFGGTPDPNAAAYQMPRVPYAQNPFITTAALGLLGGRTLNEGLANVAQNAPAGLAAKTAMQRDMVSQQDTATKRLAMNAILKLKSGKPITPQEQAAIDAAPEVMLQFGMPEPHKYMEVDGQVFDETTGQMVNLPGAGGAGGGPFRGTALDAQDSNIINRGQTDPAYRATPEFRMAWARQYETPKYVPGFDADQNPIVTPMMPPIPPGLQGPTGAAPASPNQQAPAPTDAAATAGQPRALEPVPAGTARTPEAVRTAIVKAETYKKSLDANIDAYAAAIKESGISGFPGVEQDRLNTLRNQILLDLKELNVLGVLAGPDMDIMNGMIYNPVLGSGGIGTTIDQTITGALGGNFGIATAEQRAAANAKQLKDMLAGKVTAWKSANAAGTVPPSATAPIPAAEYFK